MAIDSGEDHQLAPRLREYGLVALITSLLGLYASAALAVDYINRLQDEDYVAGCDINPMVGCGLFLDSPAASTFAVPNVVIGVAAFPVVTALAAVILSRIQLNKWLWRGLVVGVVFGIGFVTYLQYQAMFVLHGLCPWCLVIWVAMIPLFIHTLARAGEAGALGRWGWEPIVANRWMLTLLWYLIVIAAIALTLGPDLIAAFSA